MIYEQFAQERLEEARLYYCDRDRSIGAGVHYGPVIRDIYIIECCTDGSGTVVINGKEFAVAAGDCFFLLPGDTVIHTTKEPRSGVWCAVDGSAVGTALAQAGIDAAQPFAPRTAFHEICHAIEKMLVMRQDADRGADWRRTACIYEILGCLLRNETARSTHTCVQQAIGYMESCYHTAISVADMARKAGLDRSYFSTLFKAETGSTPHAYLSALRVRKACALLWESDAPIAAVAEAVGLDTQNFARLFRAETGLSPREYRKAAPL